MKNKILTQMQCLNWIYQGKSKSLLIVKMDYTRGWMEYMQKKWLCKKMSKQCNDCGSEKNMSHICHVKIFNELNLFAFLNDILLNWIIFEWALMLKTRMMIFMIKTNVHACNRLDSLYHCSAAVFNQSFPQTPLHSIRRIKHFFPREFFSFFSRKSRTCVEESNIIPSLPCNFVSWFVPYTLCCVYFCKH